MGFLRPSAWVIILILVLIFFGSKRLPGLAHSIGQSIRELKKGLEGGVSDEKESPPPAPSTIAAKPGEDNQEKRPDV